MFSTIVAYAAFILISLLFIYLIVDAVRPRTKAEQLMDELNTYRRGYRTQTDWRKVGILAVIWFAAGYHLWG